MRILGVSGGFNEVIDSNSYRMNDRGLSHGYIMQSAAREFDYAKSPMSSAMLSASRAAVDNLYSYYGSIGNQDRDFSFEDRMAVDSLVSLALGIDYEEAMRNHDYYMGMFMGEDVTDRSFLEAFWSMANTNYLQQDLAQAQTRLDRSRDPAEISRLEREVMKYEREIIKSMDYSDRSWLGNNLVKSAPVIAQQAEQLAYMAIGSLAMYGLGMKVGVPSGAISSGSTTLTANGMSIMTLAQLAGLGAKAGDIGYSIGTMYPTEKGLFSNQLMKMTDPDGNRLTGEQRDRISSIEALISSSIEVLSPDFSFGTNTLIRNAVGDATANFIRDLGNAGIQTLMESGEEFFQAGIGELFTYVAQEVGNRAGNTAFEKKEKSEIIRSVLDESIRGGVDSLFASALVSGGAIFGSGLLQGQYRNPRDDRNKGNTPYLRVQNDPTEDAINASRQVQERGDADVRAEYIVFSPDPPSREYSATVNEETGEAVKLPPIRVRQDEKTGRFIPIDQMNRDIAKSLYNSGAESFAIEIMESEPRQDARATATESYDAEYIADASPIEETGDAVVESVESLERMRSELLDKGIEVEDGGDGRSFIYTVRDTDGNERVSVVEVDESVAPVQEETFTPQQWEAMDDDIADSPDGTPSASDSLSSLRAEMRTQPQTREDAIRRNARQSQISGSVDTDDGPRFVLGKADPNVASRIAVQIYEASEGAISKRKAKALGNFYASLPDSLRSRIEETNEGRLVIREDENHSLKGERGKTLSDSLQIVLGRDSDPSTFVHEMVHIIGFSADGAFSDVVRELKTALSESGDRASVLAFLDENSRITGLSMEDAVREIEAMDDSGNLTRSQEELIASMVEADSRYDRSESTVPLPSALKKILDSLRSMIAAVYKGLTGYSRLPENVRDAFVGLFYSDIAGNTAPMTADEAERFQQANSTITANEKDLTHMTRDAWMRRKMANMPNDTLASMIDGNVYVPGYVLEQKLKQVQRGGTHPDEAMELRIIQEQIDRDNMHLIPNSERERAASMTDEEYERYLSTERSDLSEDSKRLYRKMHAYAHTPTGREIINSFKAKYGSRDGILELRDRLAERTVTYTTSTGKTATRHVVLNTVPAQMLRGIGSLSKKADFDEILMSMDSSPAMWLRTYASLFTTPEEMMAEFGVADRKVLDAYVQMSDDAFDFVRTVARDDTGRLDEFDDSDIAMLYNPDIANLSEEEALRRDAIDGSPISTLWDRIKNDPKAIKAEIRQMSKTLDVMAKNIRDLREEIENIKSTDAQRLARQQAEYERRISANNEYQQGLRDQIRETSEKRQAELRDRIELGKNRERELRAELHRQEVAYRKLQRHAIIMSLNAASQKIDNGLKRRLQFRKSRDSADILDSLYWIYSYMHDGNVSSLISQAERGKDADISIEEMMENGDAGGQDDVVLYELDRDGNPEEGTTPYMGNLGAYVFRNNEIPEAIRKNLSEHAISVISSQSTPKWRALDIGTKREILDSLVLAKREAHEKLEAARARRREYLRTDENAMASAAFTSTGHTFELTDEMWDMYLEDHKRTHATRENTKPDAVIDYFRRHPERFMKPIERGKWRQLRDAAHTMFSFIEPVCRMLDGKERGAFYQAFVQKPREAYNRMLRNINRRMGNLDAIIESRLGEKGSDRRKKSAEFLRSKIAIETNTIGEPVTERTGQELFGAYIYSQNLLGFAKLWNASGNSISLETLARINPVDTLKWINLELSIRDADDREDARRLDLGINEKDRTSTVLQGERRSVLESVKAELESIIDDRRQSLGLPADAPVGRFSLIIPENIRQAGDDMIEMFHAEQPRMAELAYSEYNILLDFQDRYFPFDSDARPSFGNTTGLFGQRKASVSSGAIKVREKDAMYPLLLDPFAVAQSAIQSHEQLINMARPVRDLNSIMGEQGGIGQIVRNRYGDSYASFLNEYIGWLAGSRDKLTDGEKKVNKVFGNIAISKIGLNFMTTIKQLASIIPAVSQGEINIMDWARTVMETTGTGKVDALMDFVREKDPSSLRGSMDWDIDRLRMQTSPEQMETAAWKARNLLMKMTESTDRWVKATVWYSAYQKYIDAGMSDREAVDRASSLVHRTQSVTDPFSMSHAQTYRDPIRRAVFMFTTDLFHYWNIIYGDIILDIRQGKGMKAVERSLGVLASAALMAFLSGKGLPDDEDDEPFEMDEFLNDMALNAVQYLVPMGGPTASEQISGYSSSLITFPRDLWQAKTMAYNGLTGNRTYSADEIISQLYDVVGGGVSAIFPFPYIAVSRFRNTIYDSKNGELTFNPGYLFGSAYGRAWEAIGLSEALY